MSDNPDELKSQIEALKARIDALEARGKPSAPIKAQPAPLRDWTENASMPPAAMRQFASVVPTAVVRELAGDSRAHAKSVLAPLPSGNVSVRSRGGYSAPLSVPGVALADKIVDAQDARDRAELIAREGKRLAQTKAKDDAA